MPAEDWFTTWLEDLQRKLRFGGSSWVPSSDYGFYLAWVEMFDELGVTESEAYVLTRRLQVDRPKYPDRVPEAVRGLLPEVRRTLPPSEGGTAGSREQAEAVSRACAECGGSGTSVRYVHPDIEGLMKTARGNPAPVGSSAGGWCGSCPLGRHFARANGLGRTWDDDPAFRLRHSPVTGRLDNKYRHHPSRWDDSRGCPIEPVQIQDVADLRRYVASLAGSFSVDRALARPIPRTPHQEPARALPGPSGGRPDLPADLDDPIVARERAAKPAQPAIPRIPEDDAADGWF